MKPALSQTKHFLIILIIFTLLAVQLAPAGSAAAQTEAPEPSASTPESGASLADSGASPPVEVAAPSTSAAVALLQWELSIAIDSFTAPTFHQDAPALLESLRTEGVEVAVSDNQVTMKGQSSLETINRLLFDQNTLGMDFLGGVVELDLRMPSDGAPLTLNLETRVTAGYLWELLPAEGIGYHQVGDPAVVSRYEALGAPAVETLQLQPDGDGASGVRLVYQRSFGPAEKPHAHLSLALPAAAKQVDIVDPTPDLPAPAKDDLVEPVQALPAVEAPAASAALPSSWDWRNRGIVTPVRNQGSCGSCWAFGTVGVMEAALRKAGGPMSDLSEQFLVSCNRDGWSCNGGHTAHAYHTNTPGWNQSQSGAVLESALPYTSTNGSCTVNYSHPYKLSNWQFVAGSESATPSVDAIKNAIYNYGPVTTTVCSGYYFKQYRSGVFQTEEKWSTCNGGINHLVNLVGWDDSTSTWILRNSWGTSWGEAGYMRIRWGTSNIGRGASWVTVPSYPSIIAPIGATSNPRPVYQWNKVIGAPAYYLAVYQNGMLKYDQIVNSTACTTNVCQAASAITLAPGVYMWVVRSGKVGAWQAQSEIKTFTVPQSLGFTSDFTGALGGWAKKAGGDWLASTFFMYSYGLEGRWSSAYFTQGVYKHFDYNVRMRRINTSNSPPNFLMVQMGDLVNNATKEWYPGYLFGYRDNGLYSIWRANYDGSYTALQNWTVSPAIVKGGWNTLRLVEVGGNFIFFINNKPLKNFYDGEFSQGTVGLQMYNFTGYRSYLQVDYAYLKALGVTTAIADKVSPAQEKLNRTTEQTGGIVSPVGPVRK